MAYSLSFAESFFWGEPEIPHESLGPTERPSCVYQALRSLPPEQWAALARDVFGSEPDHLDIETVISRILETNTCSNLDPPIDLWVAVEGWYRLLVYDTKGADDR